ncbi:GNAT family N-acetyltransferase [Halogeometricum borinquense]|uniref:GNAT family N-acetyltransferase n=1 Tax=Halogeometricum borinquense TaxID=60847 RepID=A0A6C0UMV6_9EURY|nr:GNAT family protein [Halogeometricum borinquense]QIB76500.1 GNAT family N-acetyltransferase [Halogeometricum borinquense]QIQ75810.1 GNAT family N-acetyltransferase [Halogeometricum borinquense]
MSNLFPAVVETDRLRLERAGRDTVDVRELYRVASGDDAEEMFAHVPFSPHETPKETFDFLASCEERWESGEAAEYAVRRPDDGEFVGMTGIACYWGHDTAEPGIWLRKPFWGRGYSGERARALLTLAFDRLDFSLVSVSAAADNEKSRRAVGKYIDDAGGRFEGVIRRGLQFFDGEVRDKARYTISQAEWRESGGPDESVTFIDSLL